MELQNPVQSLPRVDFKKMWPLILGAFLVVLAGVGTAWMISSKLFGPPGAVRPGATSGVKEAGILNPNFKYDTAEGIIAEGGIGGDGTHHLVREGGPSKYVYLTSSVIDLQGFVGKKVKIWGETLSSKKAGWLMDVAKIQVTE